MHDLLLPLSRLSLRSLLLSPHFTPHSLFLLFLFLLPPLLSLAVLYLVMLLLHLFLSTLPFLSLSSVSNRMLLNCRTHNNSFSDNCLGHFLLFRFIPPFPLLQLLHPQLSRLLCFLISLLLSHRLHFNRTPKRLFLAHPWLTLLLPPCRLYLQQQLPLFHREQLSSLPPLLALQPSQFLFLVLLFLRFLLLLQLLLSSVCGPLQFLPSPPLPSVEEGAQRRRRPSEPSPRLPLRSLLLLVTALSLRLHPLPFHLLLRHRLSLSSAPLESLSPSLLPSASL